MSTAPHEALRFVRINVRIFEQAQLELPVQHRPNQIIQLGLLQRARLNQPDEVEVAIRFRQLDVDPGPDRNSARFRLVCCHEVSVRLRPVTQLPDGVIVRHHETVELPLFPQHVPQQPGVGM